METIDLALAERDWRRSFARAVRSSLVKTISEPVTNAYDSYKRMGELRVPPTTGLVDAMLALNAGEVLDHVALCKHLARAPDRHIRIRVATVARADMAKRQCEVIDNAEGMDWETMKAKLHYRGADVSGQAEGAPVRGLFGRGLTDVLFGHESGEIGSIVAGLCYRAQAVWGGQPERQPRIALVGDVRRATPRDLEAFGIQGGNATKITVVLHQDCSIPQTERLFARLCGFYMLRLINADPSCRVVLEEHRSGGQLPDNILEYHFPRGRVLGTLEKDSEVQGFRVAIRAIMVRSDQALPGRAAGEDRASGLLVVDECDVVYDQTLFGYDNESNVERLFGVVQVRGLRALLRHYLNKRHQAVITDTRDGFDPKTEPYQELARVLDPWIKPYVAEEQKAAAGRGRLLSEEWDRRVKQAFKELSDLYKEETGENVDGSGPGPQPHVPSGIEFSEQHVTLRENRARRLALLVNAALVASGTPIVFDSESIHIQVLPDSVNLSESHMRDGTLAVVPVLLRSDALGARGTVSAYTEDRNGNDLEASLNIDDTIPITMVLPPAAGLEFRPLRSQVRPHVRRSLHLWVDTDVLPVGTDIVARLRTYTEGLFLLDDRDRSYLTTLIRVREKDRNAGNPRVAHVLLPFRGSGFGQGGEVVAKAEASGKQYEACASIEIIEEPPPEGAGIFANIDYQELRREVACMFEKATGALVVNAAHPVNRLVFGSTPPQFTESIQKKPVAQLRLAEVILDECIYHIAAIKYMKSGKDGLVLGTKDPITEIRNFIEERKFKIGPKILRHFVPDL